MVEIPKGIWMRPLEIDQSYELAHKEKGESSVLAIEDEGVPWYYNIMKFVELRIYHDNANKKKRRSIRIMAMQYILYGDQLYRRSCDGVHLHCLKEEEVERVMEEVH